MRFPLLVEIVVACVSCGCVDSGAGPQPKKVDPGYVGKHLLTSPPQLATHVDANIGGKVIYLGNTLGSARLVPGQSTRVTHYWKVLAPPGADYRVFMILRGAPNTADFMNLPITEMQRAHGPGTWRAGEIIEDEQDILLRPDWRSNEATFSVGLIQVGAHGTLDRMPVTGPNSADNAVIAAKLDVDLSKAPPPPGTIYVPHAQGAITIDGVANDPGWIGAVQSPDFATAEGATDPIGKATAKMTWDEQYLYVFASITDTDIISEYKNHDDTLWKADVLEMFIDADSNKRGYVELQVNVNNVTFDSWFATTRAQPGDVSWDSGMVTAVKATGSGLTGDTDTSWDVEIAIPWAAVKGRDDAMKVNTPPHVGDRWRMNIVRGDIASNNRKGTSSWNRITNADWHALDRMLTIVFADTIGGVVPNSPVDPRAPAPAPDTGSGSAGSANTGSAAPMQGSGSAASAPPKVMRPMIAQPPTQPPPPPKPSEKPVVTPTAPPPEKPSAPPTAPSVAPQAPKPATGSNAPAAVTPH